VMMLRLRHERAQGRMIPSVREYYHFYGLDAEQLSYARPDVIVMHPGPMNRGVEIDPAIAAGPASVITDQVEMGVAVRMAVLNALLSARNAKANEP
ncbi:MAG: aspartate carbamoyltransferase catalytic subunit, partial [Candidatus Devosia euplotis]|nr:aspartate carbamoyltransferase catalytic subunit [Candidatus Devosia euplotis]